jgi:hypothetical protein
MPNEIVLENEKPGNPESEWGLNGLPSTNIEGYTTDVSTNIGSQVQFKINTDATDYRIDIYRLGYYGGDGARKVATIEHGVDAGSAIQPAPLATDPTTGLVEASNWSVTDGWDVPSDSVSGVYIAKLVREDGTNGRNIIPFVVRNDASTSDIIYQTSDTTWQAYNPWGGDNLYGNSALETGTAGRSHAVSFDHPYTTELVTNVASGPWDFVFGEEYPTIRWLEANGYDVNYQSGIDTDRYGSLLLNHKIFMDAGHDEYWSAQQVANVTAARNAGVNLAFLSGNEVYWEIRWEPDANGTPYRTMVCYKTTLDGATDPSGVWTGTFRDPAQPGGAMPENALTGTMYIADWNQVDPTNPIDIPYELSQLRFWRNTAVAQLQPGETYQLAGDYLGYESDTDPNNGFRPAGEIDLSSTTFTTKVLLLDAGKTLGEGTATNNQTLYRAASGALVFSAGTVFWAWALDANHDPGPAGSGLDGTGSGTPVDPNVQQAMVNLFADMGVQPETLQSDLIVAIQTTDTTPPTAMVTPPSGDMDVGYNLIQGTAADSGGGIVAAVEISLDNGLTWNRATGTTNWSYGWSPVLAGTYNVEVRAVDDSLNLSTPTTTQLTVVSDGDLDNFAADQGWTTVDHVRQAVDVNIDGKAEYVGFGDDYTFISYYGMWNDEAGNPQNTPTFSQPDAVINNLGRNDGYTAAVQRGAAWTGYGVADSIYGQGFDGIFWYGAASDTLASDEAGNLFEAPDYETSFHFYGAFGSQQGWTSSNGFDVVFASTTDQYASILGFGSSGIVDAPQAFAPTADASQLYTLSPPVGNDSGWDQTVDVRTFVDASGKAIDLNHDGVTDFVGMGQNGLVYAYGAEDGSGHYSLGALLSATMGPNVCSFAGNEGWTNATTLREIVADPITGYDDIIGFGWDGVYVSMGQNPASNGGDPFGQSYLAMRDLGETEGWSPATTPRVIGDINGDGTPDIVGFGADDTFVAIGSRDMSGNLIFTLDLARVFADLGYNEGWNATTVRTLADVNGSGLSSLVLSGQDSTEVWSLFAAAGGSPSTTPQILTSATRLWA